MKSFLYILCLKFSIYSLKNKRKSALLDIQVKYPKEANRVANLEDIRRDYFREIDGKIDYKERLIKVISRNYSSKTAS